MKVTLVKNGTIQLILQPEDDFDNSVVKQLNGAVATLVSDNINILGNNVTGSLLLKQKNDERK